MSYQLKPFTKKLEKTLEHFRLELGKLRTGRAHPSILEDVSVDYYGTKTPLKQIASVSTPEPRMLLVQPWDRNGVSAIVKAIQTSDLGLNPTNEGDKIRIVLPPLTEETRRDLVKKVHGKAEETKIAVRNHREEEMTLVENLTGVSEDQIAKNKDDIQKGVDDANSKIIEMAQGKEKDIMTI